MEQYPATACIQQHYPSVRVDSRDVRRAEPLSDTLDYTGAVSSIDGMLRFARDVQAADELDMRALAMARQVAECLHDEKLAGWCKRKAEEQYHAGNASDPEYARYQLARMDIAELIPLMRLPGHMGWHVAARLAEFAFHEPDIDLLERAVDRLRDSTGVNIEMVDPQLEYVLADAALYYRIKGQYQEARLKAALMRAKPIFRQRAALDLCRMYLGVHYGEAA